MHARIGAPIRTPLINLPQAVDEREHPGSHQQGYGGRSGYEEGQGHVGGFGARQSAGGRHGYGGGYRSVFWLSLSPALIQP